MGWLVSITDFRATFGFILYRPEDRWKVIEVKVLDEAVASDHRAIFAILELQPNNPHAQERP